jgi:hypothetical protein
MRVSQVARDGTSHEPDSDEDDKKPKRRPQVAGFTWSKLEAFDADQKRRLRVGLQALKALETYRRALQESNGRQGTTSARAVARHDR